MTWDEYFMEIAQAISKKSHCLSHKFGAIAVRDKAILASGYNGPPRGYPHCEGIVDPNFTEAGKMCPRHAAGYKSGQGLDICPAAHAELNVLIEAARFGISLKDATLYITSPSPCRECSKAIVNAGIKEVVIIGFQSYPDVGLTGRTILEKCGVTIRIGR